MDQVSPFAETNGYAVKSGSQVALWYWDAQAVDAVLAQSKLSTSSCQVIPETVLVPQQPGVRLLALPEGFEGRVEGEQGVTGSIWWREVPTLEAWQAFCRDRGVAEGQQARVPDSSPPGWLDEPLVSNLLEQGEVWRRWATERVAYAALATLLAIPAAYFGAQWAGLHWEGESYRDAANQLKRSAAPVITARDAAFADVVFIEAIDAVQIYPNALDVLVGVAASIGPSGPVLTELDYRPGSLRLQLSNLPTNFSVAEFIDRVSRVRSLAEPQATVDGMGSMKLAATVRKRGEDRTQ
jgi:hypothetical protein